MNSNEIDYQKEFEKLDKLAEFFGIKRANWSRDIPSDFNEKLGTGFYTIDCRGISYIVKDPSYLDIWKTVDKYIKQTKDYDHTYIEQINVNEKTKEIQLFIGS